MTGPNCIRVQIYGDYKEMWELKSYVPPFEFFRAAPPEMLQEKYT